MNKKAGYDVAHNILYYVGLLFLAALVIGTVFYYYGEKYVEARSTAGYLAGVYVSDALVHRCFSDSFGDIDIELITDERMESCLSTPYASVELYVDGGVVYADNYPEGYTFVPYTTRVRSVLVSINEFDSVGTLTVEVQSA